MITQPRLLSASWRARRALKTLRVLEHKPAPPPWPSVRNCAIPQLFSVKRRGIVSFRAAWRRGAAVPGSNRTRRVHLCAGTRGFVLPHSSGCTKSSGSHRNLFGVSRGRWEAKFNNLRTRTRHDCAFLPDRATLAHRRPLRWKVSVCLNAFQRGWTAAERVKALSLWLPERGCFCRKWRHRPLVSAWPRRGEEYFQRVVAASKRRVCLLDEGIRHRGVPGSVVGGKKTSCVAISLRGRTRKDGRVTGPVRQAASWKRWHRAAKRSVFHSQQRHRSGLRVPPDDR